jgi:hypothetical protein
MSRSEKHLVSTRISFVPAACNQPWDDEQDEALRDLAKHYSRKEIAQRMHRTPMGVQSRCKALGIRLIRDEPSIRRQYDRCHVERRALQEEDDRRFVRALALAIYRGDHLSCRA